MQGFDTYLAEPQRQKLSSLYNYAKTYFKNVLLLPGYTDDEDMVKVTCGWILGNIGPPYPQSRGTILFKGVDFVQGFIPQQLIDLFLYFRPFSTLQPRIPIID